MTDEIIAFKGEVMRFWLRDERIYARTLATIDAVMKQTRADPKQCWEVVIRKHKENRSLDQNARMWAILQEVAEQTGYSADELHEICKQEFLGRERIEIKDKKGFIRVVEKPKSTTKLNTKEFAEYCDKVSMFAAQEFGVNVEWA